MFAAPSKRDPHSSNLVRNHERIDVSECLRNVNDLLSGRVVALSITQPQPKQLGVKALQPLLDDIGHFVSLPDDIVLIILGMMDEKSLCVAPFVCFR